MSFLGGGGRGLKCVTSNSWLDFGGDPDHDVDTGIFEWIFYHCKIVSCKDIESN